MLLKSLFVIALATASSAFAADRFELVNLSEGQTKSLGTCGGSASLRRLGGTLTLTIRDAKNCSVIKRDGEQVEKLPNGQGSVQIGFNERLGSNQFAVYATSESGKTGTQIFVHSNYQPATRSGQVTPYTPPDFTLSTGLFGRKIATLEDCGGEVYLQGSGASTSISFQNVKNCSNFDIVTSNGQSINFPNHKINQYPVVNLPMVPGSIVKVVVKSDTSKHYDVFDVNYGILF